MKKIRANVLLTSIILTIALILLGIFGCDMAYVVLARFKLQKATEAVAAECVSSLAESANNTARTDLETKDIIEEIVNQYIGLYRTRASDLNNFWINRIEYKTLADADHSSVLKVSTEASVYPAFLRFVGTGGIRVYAISYAKTKRVLFSDNTDIENGKHHVEFPPDNRSNIPIITHKPRGQGDFAIEFKYINEPGRNYYSENGGYFVFGSYKNEDNLTDIGYGAKDVNTINIPDLGICINNATGSRVVTFNLNTENKDAEQLRGFTKKVDKIKVYRALGAPLNPMALDVCTKNNYRCPPLPRIICDYVDGYLDRNAKITLTILNNVQLISKQNYQNAHGTNEMACIPNNSETPPNISVECRAR